MSFKDQSALLSLKSKITSDPYNNIMQNWTVKSPVCAWAGVTCGHRHNRVTYLNISYMGLTGVIPPEFGNLSFLTSLDMRHNNLFGMIPKDLSHLRRLRYADISENGFSGEVPSCFAFLPRLEVLYLTENSFTSLDSFLDSFSNASKLSTLDVAYNSLQGEIAESIGNLRNLSMLDLQSNHLIGLIPSSIFNISTLEVLSLSDNILLGTLPDDVCHRQPSLRGIYLSLNELYGEIPSNISSCSQLEALSLSHNNFTGSIPKKIGNLTRLDMVFLGYNKLTGEIPGSLCELEGLEFLGLSVNELSGTVPANIFNMTGLRLISLVGNKFTGNLPSELDYFLPKLQGFFVGANDFSGVFPKFVLNSSRLIDLDLSHNKFTGPIPNTIGDLRSLQSLNLEGNYFTSEVSIINQLTNCRDLTEVSLAYNRLNWVFPKSIGNLSSSLTKFNAIGCGMKGNIPSEIGNLTGLTTLFLASNDLSGEIPRTIRSLAGLQRLYLSSNRIEGIIPNELCGLKSLGLVYLDANQLRGSMPGCLGNITSLRQLSLSNNSLTSGIPSSVWNLKDISILSFYSNSLTGSLSSQIGELKAAVFIDLGVNNFSGAIPNSLGNLNQLVNLSLAYNNFRGPIPASMGGMINLFGIDLSHNKLNGTIPKALESLRNLGYFDVSYNELSGEIPSDGPFRNFTSRSFMFNGALCGPSRFNVSSCPEPRQNKSKKTKKILLPLLISIGIGALLFITCLAFIAIRYRRKKTPPIVSDTDAARQPVRFSYYELLSATENYSESNLLGSGSFGSVYKGVLRDGTILAVKVFHIQLERSLRSFEVECEALRNLRHRNLVKVLGSCTNQDFKAIVLDYMRNGSLDKCLYSENRSLDVVQRLDIMIDVASALEYLHHGYSTSVVHCDLKPENVLLDEEMVAHVSDFGITKYLNEGESITHTRTLATLGYMAPEYGSEGIVSTKCDVYSYGIMLLETFTGKRPSDEMFSEGVTLRDWVKGSMPNEAIQVIDANLISADEEINTNEKLRGVFSILELGLSCSANSPVDRKNMKDVVAELKKIRIRLTTPITRLETVEI